MIKNEEFDSELLKLPIYSRFPQLLPLIGEEYSTNNKKVIFIGESHYLPKTSCLHLDPKTWYESNQSLLDDEERAWLNTRDNAGSGENQKYEARAFSIYRNIEKAILESDFDPPNQVNMFRYCSFYNYYLRPAETGVSIKQIELDKDKSFENFIDLQKILDFDFAIFVSKRAFNDFNWYYKNRPHNLSDNFISLPHPGCSWWNRKSNKYRDSNNNRLTGKKKLIDIINVNELFKN